MHAHDRSIGRKLGVFIVSLAFPAWAVAAPLLQVNLTRSDYHGYGVSCFGMKDGTLQAGTTDGTAPYTYKWSNGSSGANIADLAAGYYRVEVYDSNGEYGIAEITLEQPLPMKLDVDVYEYPNGYNISCYECNNGNASVIVMGGAAPFTASWSDGPTGDVRYNLGPKDYGITVTDANGCEGAKTTIYLRGPARNDWSMSGNSGTTPGVHYIGTPDNKDLVFKSNGMERLRLMANGAVRLSNGPLANGSLYLNSNGELRSFGFDEADPVPSNPCAMGVLTSVIDPHWRVGGNYFAWPQCDETTAPRLGTKQALDLDIITADQVRMVISRNGNVGIGTTTPSSKLHVAGDLLVRDGNYGDIVTSSSATTGPVLWARNSQAAWGLSIGANGKGHILGDWNDPHPIMTFAYNKVGIGTEEMPGDDYNLFVSKGILAEKVKVSLPGNWPDFVFAEGHALMTMDDLRSFLAKHRHLPGIPAAQELETQGGIDLGEMQQSLVKTVEEQALYILQLEKRQTQLEQRLNALETAQH